MKEGQKNSSSYKEIFLKTGSCPFQETEGGKGPGDAGRREWGLEKIYLEDL